MLLQLGVWAKRMIRQSLDVVPTVQPKYRLEEDARLAAEKRRQGGRQPVTATGTRVERYCIFSCDDVWAMVSGSHAAGGKNLACSNGNENEESKEKVVAGARLYSWLPSPELGTRVPQTLQVLEAPKKNSKRIRRTLYRATLRSSRAPGETNEEEDEEDEGDETLEDETAPRFSSLPVPEYEDMSSILLLIPTVAEEGAVARARVLDAPVHTLRHERTGAAKTGQGISTSWYSGLDVRSVGFKRSYIDGDEDADEGDAWSTFSDDALNNARQGGRKNREGKEEQRVVKRNKVEANENTAANTNGIEGTKGVKKSSDDVQQATNDGAPVSLLPTSALSTLEGAAQRVDKVDFSEINVEDLESLTGSLLQQWASAGKAAMPFSEVTKVVLKSHPKYTEMKAKHQSPQGRQEALEWFRVSQKAVRSYVLHLGYTIDSTNNVYLSRPSDTQRN
ncbi:hypothetical protein, conserved [Trypanosoma cruzi]|uniref:Uncharacterized protein n=1 Tax=Trypanosoma cruzi (strain CL Brener) TaxID=353153 RepID=Q4D764_TRYCC|nr:hypothetical protein, conserved [Trypanosoma cruzi]EAN88365.1 hypothetical protein, conserved [Trypanosoma cruzi]|eukprot:XP_810216.1 hypothetical protein [Trypanosoma cruzi strain CL Brener]